MTIDERLDAIAQTLELVAGMQQANEKAIAELARIVVPIAQCLEEPGADPPSHN